MFVQLDLLDALAFPLPITVICELLDVPDIDRDRFRAWTDTLVSTATAEEVEQASGAMVAYLASLVVTKRAEHTDDLLSALVHASDEGDALSETELVSMAFLLLVAGHETTVNLIANGSSRCCGIPTSWPRCAPTRRCCRTPWRSSSATRARSTSPRCGSRRNPCGWALP